MGMIKMTKKKIWNAGCVVLVLLLLCTVISFPVERLMRIPVEVVRGIQSEEEKAMQLARIPLSCLILNYLILFLPSSTAAIAAADTTQNISGITGDA